MFLLFCYNILRLKKESTFRAERMHIIFFGFMHCHDKWSMGFLFVVSYSDWLPCLVFIQLLDDRNYRSPVSDIIPGGSISGFSWMIQAQCPARLSNCYIVHMGPRKKCSMPFTCFVFASTEIWIITWAEFIAHFIIKIIWNKMELIYRVVPKICYHI
jgi:hypothetical protein